MRFDQYSFHPNILDNLKALKFVRPTDIQFKAISPIMKGEDVLAIAQTGTGKTAAFAIPVIDYLAKSLKHQKQRKVRCLVMEPTRELSLQITDVFNSIAANTGVKVVNLFGGVSQDEQVKGLLNGADVVVSTPGRMFDLIHQGHLKLDGLEILVVDEADHMLDLGFYKDIKDILRHIPRERQTLFFSATINERIKKLAYSIVRNAIRIQISPENPVNKNIQHQVAFIEMDDKRFFLERLVNEFDTARILVFVRTKVRAERVKNALERAGISSETIHGDKDQSDRLNVLEGFKTGKNRILIATDVSARGIDIAGVEIVVNYDLPELPENYVHRVGRTGRGGKKGQAVSFCSKEEKVLLKEIESYIGSDIEVMKIDRESYQETISFTADETQNDWQNLIRETDAFKPKAKKGR
ncbi:MAG: DEAD/DEAH box helicase [Bacteroidetes bacterium]|nr:DEAD/DEAH box helicase [Bacteroidota bacterium]